MKKLNHTTIVTKFREKILGDKDISPQSQKIIATTVLALGLTAFLYQFNQKRPEISPANENSSIDTLIPTDQGLVTIQVANYESLDQIIGQYGVVDLYSTPLVPGEKARLVAKQVRLIRTHKSRRHFSVLLPTKDVGLLAGHPGEFTVSIRNPKQFGTKIVKRKGKPAKRRIQFETESL